VQSHTRRAFGCCLLPKVLSMVQAGQQLPGLQTSCAGDGSEVWRCWFPSFVLPAPVLLRSSSGLVCWSPTRAMSTMPPGFKKKVPGGGALYFLFSRWHLRQW
jgi:hypothetical protein